MVEGKAQGEQAAQQARRVCGIRLETDSVEEAREIFLSPSLDSLRLQLSFLTKNHLLCSLIMKSGSQESLVLGQV